MTHWNCGEAGVTLQHFQLKEPRFRSAPRRVSMSAWACHRKLADCFPEADIWVQIRVDERDDDYTLIESLECLGTRYNHRLF